MKSKFLIFAIAISVFFACNDDKAEQTTEYLNGNHKLVVKEVITGKSYTYIKAEEGDDTYWAALTKTELEVGKTYYYKGSMEMKNFKSKELDRTFDRILFIEQLSENVISDKVTAESTHGSKAKQNKAEIKIDPIAEGITISQLYAEKSNFAGKKIKVKGKVVKLSEAIMNTNWVHIQDGTEHSGSFDLTLTTTEKVKIGDVVVFEGVISLDKNIGAGYFFDILMEDSKIIQ